MKKGDLLFVYGTLRRGEGADLSRNLETSYICEDRISGELFNIGWYPGAKIPDDGRFEISLPSIVGDLFRLRTPSIIAVLDAYEGYPNLYNRRVVITEKGNMTWVYVYNGPVPKEKMIPGGDWKHPSAQPPNPTA